MGINRSKHTRASLEDRGVGNCLVEVNFQSVNVNETSEISGGCSCLLVDRPEIGSEMLAENHLLSLR